MLEQKDYIVNRSWVEIDLNALAENLRSIRSLIRRNCEIMAVVKADGYGHGALQIAPLLLSCGASRLAVSLLDEAIHLRENGITAPILILSYTDPRRAEEIIRYNVTQTVYSWDLIHALNEAGRKTGRKADVHIKIDTGMSRIGFVSGFNSVHEAQAICALPNIVVEGIFTHFATADEADDHYLRLQFSRFMSICRELEKQGIYIPIKHCCNSAATLRYPEMHLDMVRTGLVMYGFLPDNCAGFATAVRPAMTLKSGDSPSSGCRPGFGGLRSPLYHLDRDDGCHRAHRLCRRLQPHHGQPGVGFGAGYPGAGDRQYLYGCLYAGRQCGCGIRSGG